MSVKWESILWACRFTLITHRSGTQDFKALSWCFAFISAVLNNPLELS